MRFFTAIIGLIYTATCLAQIDKKNLETVLNNTFQEVVGLHDFLVLKELDQEGVEKTVSEIVIDNEYSDFDLGRIKANLTTKTIPLESNLSEEIALSLNLSTDITDTEDERKSFDFNANLNLKGNTLALLKRISTALGECTQKPIKTSDSTDEEVQKQIEEENKKVHTGNILCHVQTGIDSSSAVVDLKGGLQEAANYANLVYNKDNDSDSILGDFFSSLLITPKGEDLVLTVNIDSEVGLDENEINRNELKVFVTLIIREKGIEIDVNGSIIFEDRQYDEYVDLVKRVATDLQDRESNTHITYYEDNLYLVFSLIEGFLVIDDDDDF